MIVFFVERYNIRQIFMFGRFGLKNHTNSIEWYHFQWPRVTLDPDFKVLTFFNIEYLRNDTRQSHSYYEHQ